MQRQIKIIKKHERQNLPVSAEIEITSKIDVFRIREKWQKETALVKEFQRATDRKAFFGVAV